MIAVLPKPSEIEAFRGIARRRRWVWGLFLIFMPIAVPAQLLSETVAELLVGGWAVAFAVATGIHGLSHCPRCGKRCFMKAPWSSNPWASKCLHCRIKLYWTAAELSQVSSDLQSLAPPA
jgi:hypothetical protein